MSKISLETLLTPKSIAVVGASPKAGTVGNEAILNLQKGGYKGDLFFVNPRYDELFENVCFDNLHSLPKKPEHVIFAVNDTRLESVFDELIQLEIKACTIFSALILKDDSSPGLKNRIAKKASLNQISVMGANTMGVYNIENNTLIGGFDTRAHPKGGNVALISQSGAGMSGIVDCEERIKFNFTVSTGYELTTSMEDYLDYAIDLPGTKVIGLFLETVRKPEYFFGCLERAAKKKIPIIVIKVGKTELSRKMAESHSGAMAGSDRAYDAVFRHYGVLRVDDMDQMAACLIMFSQATLPKHGNLVCLHDSGGERQLLIDLANDLSVPLTEISADTETKLSSLLDPGLPAVNPLDAWRAGGTNAPEVMASCFETLLLDQSAAMGAVVHDRGPSSEIYASYIPYLERGKKLSKKPVFLVSNRQGSGESRLAVELTHKGLPVIDGINQFLTGTKKMFEYRDFQKLFKNRSKLKSKKSLSIDKSFDKKIDERDTYDLLKLYKIPMNEIDFVSSMKDLEKYVGKFPLVMKTANNDIHHKFDVGGVILNIDNFDDLKRAYNEITEKFGERVSISPFIDEDGIEMILGISNDDQFGPLVLIGFGGVYTEVFNEVILLLPPFNLEEVGIALESLPHFEILKGTRGGITVDIESYCKAAVGLSQFAVDYGHTVKELDINPIKVMQKGCVGLDMLLVNKV